MVVYGEGFAYCSEHGAVTPAPRAEAALAAGRFEPPCPICGRPLTPALVDEATPFDPRNAYASSKVAQEFYAANWARISGGAVAALRYHNVYGPGMPRNTPYAGVAAIFTSALRRGEAPTVFEDGRQQRDFIHVAMLPLRRRSPARDTSTESEHLMSDRARHARSATWRSRWPTR